MQHVPSFGHGDCQKPSPWYATIGWCASKQEEASRDGSRRHGRRWGCHGHQSLRQFAGESLLVRCYSQQLHQKWRFHFLWSHGLLGKRNGNIVRWGFPDSWPNFQDRCAGYVWGCPFYSWCWFDDEIIQQHSQVCHCKYNSPRCVLLVCCWKNTWAWFRKLGYFYSWMAFHNRCQQLVAVEWTPTDIGSHSLSTAKPCKLL